MQADAQAVVDAFGKNEQVMRVCWIGDHEGSGPGRGAAGGRGADDGGAVKLHVFT